MPFIVFIYIYIYKYYIHLPSATGKATMKRTLSLQPIMVVVVYGHP